MASEIKADYASGYTLYGVVRDSTGKVAYLSGEAFETWGASSHDTDDYDISLTDAGGDLYEGDFPSWIANGIYRIQIRRQTGSSPDRSADPLVWTNPEYSWQGTGGAAGAAGVLSSDELDFANKVLGHIGEGTIAAADTSATGYIECERYLDDVLDEIIGSHPWNKAMRRAMLIQTEPDTPLFGYDYAYTRPSDVLRIWKPKYWDYEYRVEEGPAGNLVVMSSEGGAPDAWATGTYYQVGFMVKNGSDDTVYECLVAHTAGTLDDEPGVGAVESTYWDTHGDDLYVLDVEYIAQLTVSELPWYLKYPVELALAARVAPRIKDDGRRMATDIRTELLTSALPLARYYDGQEGQTKRGLETSYWLDARTEDA